MIKTSSIEDCFATIYKDICKKYPKTDEISSENLQIRCFEILCQKHNPKLNRYNIRKKIGLTSDWYKRMKKGEKTTLINCIIFALHTIDSYDEVIEFLFLNGHSMFVPSLKEKERIYLEGIRFAYAKVTENGQERCEVFNNYIEQQGLCPLRCVK